jgi:hypothetical protein
MKKANATNKALIGLTALFMLIAAFSFAAFRESEEICSEAKNCTQPAPSKGGEMIWDGFSHHFVSFVTIK